MPSKLAFKSTISESLNQEPKHLKNFGFWHLCIYCVSVNTSAFSASFLRNKMTWSECRRPKYATHSAGHRLQEKQLQKTKEEGYSWRTWFQREINFLFLFHFVSTTWARKCKDFCSRKTNVTLSLVLTGQENKASS